MADSAENILQGKFGDLPDAGDVRNQPVYLTCDHHGKWKWMNTMDGPALSPDCPQCIEDRKLSTDLGRAAIPPRYQHHSLDTYCADSAGQKRALGTCRTYVSSVRDTMRDGTNLLLVGRVGTGKTHLACGIAREFIAAGHTALYVRTADLISLIRETWRPDSKKSERRAYKELADYDLLVIDEVGVQAGTENEQQILFNVINGRNENMRPTVLISNLNVKQIGDMLGERSFDRIRESAHVVTFEWESWRGKS